MKFFFSNSHKKQERHHLFTVSISHKALGTNGEFSHIKGHQLLALTLGKMLLLFAFFHVHTHMNTYSTQVLILSSLEMWEVPNEYAYNVKNNQNNIQSPLTVQPT